MLMGAWKITMLGRFEGQQGETLLDRFRTRKTASLLAYLAFYQQRYHAREELADRFWPDTSPELGLKSLGVSLSSLRSILAPPGVNPDRILQADRRTVRLNPEAIETDVNAFLHTLQQVRKADNPQERIPLLETALTHYGGELLSGFYDEWIFPERERLAQEHRQATMELIILLEDSAEYAKALPYALQAVHADLYEEEACACLMRLYAATGQVDEALRHYEALELRLREDINTEPEPELQHQAAQLREAHPAIKQARTQEPSKSVSAPIAPASEASPPPSPAPPAVRLPLTLTRFFGRETERERLLALLHDPDCRLLTLTGPGGSGKTRLAIETARRFSETFTGNILFIPLADLTEPSQIVTAIRHALQRPEQPGVTPEAQIVAALSQTPTLLVLDNLEHLQPTSTLPEASDTLLALVVTLLTQVPKLTLLTTSRHPLALAGEQEFSVSPLPIPHRPGTPERLLEFASVQLFADRARLKQSDFQVNSRNADAIAMLCERLEGIPLAIELAASWARIYSPVTLLEQVQESLTNLASRDRGAPERQRTLQEVIAWSYRLLTTQQQQFFTHLSVFQGGWTAEAAKAVCDTQEAQNLLARLLEHSLVDALETDTGTLRYRMLEMVREYAETQLSADERQLAFQRHRAWFLALAERAASAFNTFNILLFWANKIEEDQPNFLAALDRTGETEAEHRVALRMAAILGQVWAQRDLRAGSACLKRLLDTGIMFPPSLERAQALNSYGGIVHWLGDMDTVTTAHTEALKISRLVGDEREEAFSLHHLGWAAASTGQFETARNAYRESMAMTRRLEMEFVLQMSLAGLAILDSSQGDFAAARTGSEELLVRARRVGNTKSQVIALTLRSQMNYQSEDFDSLRRDLAELLPLCQQLGGIVDLYCGLLCAALLAWRTGGGERSAALSGAVNTLARTTGFFSPEWQQLYQTMIEGLGQEMGESEFARAFEYGSNLPLEQAVALALTATNTSPLQLSPS